MRRFRLLLCAPALALATSAHAGGLDEAKAILDASAPLQCELLTLHFRMLAATRESPNDATASKRYEDRGSDLQRALAGDMQRFEAARATLTPEEQTRLAGHGVSLLKACARQAEQSYGMHIPVQPEMPAPPLKVVPYTPPPAAKALQAQGVDTGAPIGKQSVTE